MGKIVAIGGGEIRLGETDRIDSYIVSLANKTSPKLLFIPTASQDSVGYINSVVDHFGQLGCHVCSLCILAKDYSDDEIRRLILGSDIVYVGGGDTVRMMEEWKKHRVGAHVPHVDVPILAFGHGPADRVSEGSV